MSDKHTDFSSVEIFAPLLFAQCCQQIHTKYHTKIANICEQLTTNYPTLWGNL